MPRRGQPAFHIANRGVSNFHLRVRTGGRDLHSGAFGGAALNANHALLQSLADHLLAQVLICHAAGFLYQARNLSGSAIFCCF